MRNKSLVIYPKVLLLLLLLVSLGCSKFHQDKDVVALSASKLAYQPIETWIAGEMGKLTVKVKSGEATDKDWDKLEQLNNIDDFVLTPYRNLHNEYVQAKADAMRTGTGNPDLVFLLQLLNEQFAILMDKVSNLGYGGGS